MRTVYDMSTGQITETGVADVPAYQNAPQAEYGTELELGLQPVICEQRTKSALPPELVLADLDAFLYKMS